MYHFVVQKLKKKKKKILLKSYMVSKLRFSIKKVNGENYHDWQDDNIFWNFCEVQPIWIYSDYQWHISTLFESFYSINHSKIE